MNFLKPFYGYFYSTPVIDSKIDKPVDKLASSITSLESISTMESKDTESLLERVSSLNSFELDNTSVSSELDFDSALSRDSCSIFEQSIEFADKTPVQLEKMVLRELNKQLSESPELFDVVVFSIPSDQLFNGTEIEYIKDSLLKVKKSEEEIKIFNQEISSFSKKYSSLKSSISKDIEDSFFSETILSIKQGLVDCGLNEEEAEKQTLCLLSCFSFKINELIEDKLKVKDCLAKISDSDQIKKFGSLFLSPLLVRCSDKCGSFVDKSKLSIDRDGIKFSSDLYRAFSVINNGYEEYQIPCCVKIELQFNEGRFDGTIELERLIKDKDLIEDEVELKQEVVHAGAGVSPESYFSRISNVAGSVVGFGQSLYEKIKIPAFYGRMQTHKKPDIDAIDEYILNELVKIPLFNKGNVSPMDIKLDSILAYKEFNPLTEACDCIMDAEALEAYAILQEESPEEFSYLSKETIEKFEKAGGLSDHVKSLNKILMSSDFPSNLIINSRKIAAKLITKAQAYNLYAEFKKISPEEFTYLSEETIEKFEKKLDLMDEVIILKDDYKEALIDALEEKVIGLLNSDVNRRSILFQIGPISFDPFKGELDDKKDYCCHVYGALKNQLIRQGVDEKKVRLTALGLIHSTCQVFDAVIEEELDLLSKLMPIISGCPPRLINIIPCLSNSIGNKELITLTVSPDEISLDYDVYRSFKYVKPIESKLVSVPTLLNYHYILKSDTYSGSITTLDVLPVQVECKKN